MVTLWDLITGNSSLPVQSGNTLWDHLNNQQGGGLIITEGDYVVDEVTVECLVEQMNDQEAELFFDEVKLEQNNTRLASVDETLRIEDGDI